MNQWKRLFCRLMEPPLLLLLLLTLLCVPSLFYVLDRRLEQSAAAYPLFVLSAYTLFLWVMRCIGVAKRVKAAIYGHHLARLYMTDLSLRGHVSLHTSTAINCCYALFKLGAGIYYRSFWFGAIAVYYLILAAARALLLHSTYRKASDPRQEYRTSRLCGCLLLALNIALACMTVQMVVDGKGYAYPGTLIFAMAFYAFYSVTMSIVNLVRFRKLRSPVLAVSKALELAVALVSMLSLQTAMFASFGGTLAFQRLMNALTGGAVCLILFAMAILMIVRASRKLKMLPKSPEEMRVTD